MIIKRPFPRPRPPTPCRSAPAGARAWCRPAPFAPPTLASTPPGCARGAPRHREPPRAAMWKVSVCVHDCGGHTTKHGAPHASWRWSQGQRPGPPGGTPPRARRRPAAAAGGGACLSPSRRPARCRRRPAAGRPARGGGGVRKRGGQPGARRR